MNWMKYNKTLSSARKQSLLLGPANFKSELQTQESKALGMQIHNKTRARLRM